MQAILSASLPDTVHAQVVTNPTDLCKVNLQLIKLILDYIMLYHVHSCTACSSKTKYAYQDQCSTVPPFL